MEEKQHGFIDGFTLKILMAILMVLDHLYYHLFPDSLAWGHYAARVVAPVFVYLVTEGLRYTRDRQKYIMRILSFGVAMLVGNGVLSFLYGKTIDNSILMTLGLSAAVITTIDKVREQGSNKVLWAAASLGFFILCLPFEGGYMIPVMAIIFYYLRKRPLIMWVVYIVTFGGSYFPIWLFTGQMPSQFYMIFAFIPILCYNGKRGRGGVFSKYFFYVFYPLHIWIIFLVEQYVL